jgi:hypothetical protein
MGLLRRRSAIAETPSSAIALPRVPTFALTRPVASPNLEVVTTWPVLSTARQAALSIPSVAMCRDLIVGAAVQMAIFRSRGGQRIDSGALLRQPDPDTTWAATLGGTIEDLIYEGRAYWLVLARDGVSTDRNPDGLPVRARWIPVGDVQPELSPDAGSYSRLDGYHVAGVENLVAPENVIRFDSPLPGVLYKGAQAIANALALEDAAARMSSIDIPAGTLTNEGAELSETEAEELVARFELARRNHTVAFLQGVTFERQQLSAEDLELVAARAHSATEMARLHNVPVAAIAASPSGSGSPILYANLGAELALIVSQAVAPHLTTIEQTLSLPSVTPAGQTVSFDVAAFLRADPAALQEYVLGLVKENVISVEEGRRMLGIGAAPANLQPGTV